MRGNNTHPLITCEDKPFLSVTSAAVSTLFLMLSPAENYLLKRLSICNICINSINKRHRRKMTKMKMGAMVNLGYMP